jgi:23S rRNA pseudouridine2605 synthase
VEKFDTRDKYERGSLKYGRRPSNGEERETKQNLLYRKED